MTIAQAKSTAYVAIRKACPYSGDLGHVLSDGEAAQLVLKAAQ
jgi:hypothetical protein